MRNSRGLRELRGLNLRNSRNLRLIYFLAFAAFLAFFLDLALAFFFSSFEALADLLCAAGLPCAQAGADNVIAIIAAKATVMNFFIRISLLFSLPTVGGRAFSVGVPH